MASQFDPLGLGAGMSGLFPPDTGDYSGMAKYPGYIPMAMPNQQGLDKYRQEAMRTGPSPWANLMANKSLTEEGFAKDAAAKDAAGRGADARSLLSMRGGLSSGASERIDRGSARNALDMSQQAGQQGIQNRQQIGINDEQNRVSQLGSLPGMENQGVQVQNQNIAGQNAFNMNAYKTQMDAWGANKQAQATQNSGKK
jgi:hypothetical protein